MKCYEVGDILNSLRSRLRANENLYVSVVKEEGCGMSSAALRLSMSLDKELKSK